MLKFGLRNIKTAIALMLTLCIEIIFYFISPDFATTWYSPFFAGIAAVYTMQRENSKSFALARIRSFGSIFGGIFGMVVVLMYESILKDYLIDHYGYVLHLIVLYALTAIFITLLIAILVRFKQHDLVFVSALTYLSVTISLRNNLPVFVFATNRISSTIIGVLITLLINNFRLSCHKNQDILFVSGLDECLLTNEKRLTPYTTYTLTTLIRDGLNFTISTTRTPASLSKILLGIPLKLELMIMNGVVNYDISKETFTDIKPMSKLAQDGIHDYFSKLDRNIFSYAIIDQALSIYHTTFENEAEERFYLDRKNDYFRNHIKGKISSNDPVVFYILLDKLSTIEAYVSDLKAICEKEISFQIYPYTKMVDYFFLKIHTSHTSKKLALDHFLSKHPLKTVIAFGSKSFDIDMMHSSDYSIALNSADEKVKAIADIILPSDDPDDLVKWMKRVYYMKKPVEYLNRMVITTKYNQTQSTK